MNISRAMNFIGNKLTSVPKIKYKEYRQTNF